MKRKVQTKRVIILGAGQIGTHIAASLSKEGYNVVIVDANPAAIEEAGRYADVATITGNGTDPSIFIELGLNEHDMFLAVTDSDETNIMACSMAKAFGVEKKVARVRKPYYKSYQGTPIDDDYWKKVGVEIIFNQSELARREIERLLENPGAKDTISIGQGKLEIVAYRVQEGSVLIGRRLIGLRDVPIFSELIVAAITTSRGNGHKKVSGIRHINELTDSAREYTLIPRGDYRIKEGDLLFIAGKKEEFEGIAPLFDPDLPKGFRKVFVLGGNVQAHYIAESLVKKFPRKKFYLVERSRKDAFSASEKLSQKINVLHVDVHDMESLRQEGLDKTSVYIGASVNEDDNLLGCLMAKEEAGAKTIALLQNTTFVHLVPYLQLDAFVSSKLLIADDVLKTLRKDYYDILSARIHDAELLELVVPSNSILVGQVLSDFRFPENAIIVAIFRGEEVIIPKGTTILKDEDHVAIFALKSAIDEIQYLFQDR